MSGDQLDLDAVARRVRDATELLEQEAHALRRDTAVRGRDTLAAQAIDAAAVMLRDDALDLVAEVRRLRAWQRTVADACGLTEIHMGYSPYVPDATPGVVAMIEDAFTRSLYHAECERVEWEEAVARGEV